MKHLFSWWLSALVLSSAGAAAAEVPCEASDVRAVWPKRRHFIGGPVKGLVLEATDRTGERCPAQSEPFELRGLTKTSSGSWSSGQFVVGDDEISAAELSITLNGSPKIIPVPRLPAWMSLLPAFIAVLLALVTRQVLLSLFGGVWLGAALLGGWSYLGFGDALLTLVAVLADADRAKVVIFTLMMGGMVGVVGASGGSLGIVAKMSRFATTPKSGAVATWIAGMFIFFDDYASSLLVGSTMRPVTDRLRISREKLSYIVDSTAAPITSLAAVSTWVGYEVSVLGDAMRASGLDRDAYEVFLSGMPSRFYQIFALLFVLIVAFMGRDFGSMLTAERRARREGKPLRDGAEPLLDTQLVDDSASPELVEGRWWLAVVPVVLLVVVVAAVLAVTGIRAGHADGEAWAKAEAAGTMRLVGHVLGNAASYDALLYAAGAGAFASVLLSVGVRALSMKRALDSFMNGVRAMTLAVVVLCLAWAIGRVMGDLEAGRFVASAIGESVPPWSLPLITFSLGAVIALSTGTSWGAIAILFPIALPVVVLHQAHPDFDAILLGTTSAILGGAVYGDHCSPISDTTVLSSIACAADHIDHTRTQAPYATLAALVSAVIGYLPLGFGLSPYVSIVLGLLALVLVLRIIGKDPELG